MEGEEDTTRRTIGANRASQALAGGVVTSFCMLFKVFPVFYSYATTLTGGRRNSPSFHRELGPGLGLQESRCLVHYLSQHIDISLCLPPF